MKYSSRELKNIANSLEHWNISEGQKGCVTNLINQAGKLNEIEYEIDNNDMPTAVDNIVHIVKG